AVCAASNFPYRYSSPKNAGSRQRKFLRAQARRKQRLLARRGSYCDRSSAGVCSNGSMLELFFFSLFPPLFAVFMRSFRPHAVSRFVNADSFSILLRPARPAFASISRPVLRLRKRIPAFAADRSICPKAFGMFALRYDPQANGTLSPQVFR